MLSPSYRSEILDAPDDEETRGWRRSDGVVGGSSLKGLSESPMAVL